ncbi:MAG TPA: hypothetical protein VMV17_07370 [Streptosporangiaceae bacterium]|nr:hypothetical protein [Streptosporangiaceae bacterium]
MAGNDGPYLNYAVICEKVLRETDDVLSLIRIIDRATVTIQVAAAPGAGTQSIPITPLIPLSFVVGLKSGGYVGSVPVKVRINTPSGSEWPEFETPARFEEGEDRGAVIILPIQFPAQDEGVYWFTVQVSGDVVTRVPLHVIKNEVAQTVPPQIS